MVLSAALFPSLVCGVAFLINFIAIYYHASRAIPFLTMVSWMKFPSDLRLWLTDHINKKYASIINYFVKCHQKKFMVHVCPGANYNIPQEVTYPLQLWRWKHWCNCEKGSLNIYIHKNSIFCQCPNSGFLQYSFWLSFSWIIIVQSTILENWWNFYPSNSKKAFQNVYLGISAMSLKCQPNSFVPNKRATFIYFFF